MTNKMKPFLQMRKMARRCRDQCRTFHKQHEQDLSTYTRLGDEFCRWKTALQMLLRDFGEYSEIDVHVELERQFKELDKLGAQVTQFQEDRDQMTAPTAATRVQRASLNRGLATLGDDIDKLKELKPNLIKLYVGVIYST